MARDVKIAIVGDASSLRKALGTAEGDLQTFGDKVTTAGTKIAGVGAKMTAVLTLPLAGLGAVAFDAASDLNESMSKAQAVFDDMTPSVIKFGESAATSLGMSKQAAIEATASFGAFLQAMGVAQGPATDISMQLVKLASDLASFNNVSPEEALLALRSGLSGEAEPLRRFNVALSAARVEAEALSSGLVTGAVDANDAANATLAIEKANEKAAIALKKSGAESLEYRSAVQDIADAEAKLSEVTAGKIPELTAAQKAQATFAIIMKDTALAQGDFSRTADGAANKQRILKAQLENTAATIGNKLIPIGMKLLEWVQKLLGWFDRLSPEMQNVVLICVAAAAAIGPLTTVIGGLVAAVGFLISPVGLVIVGIAALVAGVIYAYKNFDGFRELVDNVASFMVDTVWPAIQTGVEVFANLIAAAAEVVSWIANHWDMVLLLAGPLGAAVVLIIKNWDTIKSTIVTFIGSIIFAISMLVSVWQGAWGVVQTVIEKAWAVIEPILGFIADRIHDVQVAVDKLSNFGTGGGLAGGANLPSASGGPGASRTNFPRLASGGIVTRPTFALVGERGPEAVVPLGQMSGGIHLTVNAGMGADGNRIGQQIVEWLRSYERSNGTGWRN